MDIETSMHVQHLLSVQAIPGTFAAITKELADGTTTSSVPVMTKVGLDIFERLSQMPLPFVAIQLCTDLNCCSAVL